MYVYDTLLNKNIAAARGVNCVLYYVSKRILFREFIYNFWTNFLQNC